MNYDRKADRREGKLGDKTYNNLGEPGAVDAWLVE
jgi:hypothetical protein